MKKNLFFTVLGMWGGMNLLFWGCQRSVIPVSPDSTPTPCNTVVSSPCTSSPTCTPTTTPTFSFTSTPTTTFTGTATTIPTNTATLTPTSTATPTATFTASANQTGSPTWTPSYTCTGGTSTPTSTATPFWTSTATNTAVPINFSTTNFCPTGGGPTTYSGTATTYTLGGIGACGYPLGTFDPNYYAAIAGTGSYGGDYQQGEICGACVAARYNSNSVTVMIIDNCSTCTISNQLELGPAPFQTLTGNTMGNYLIDYNFVPCPASLMTGDSSGNIEYMWSSGCAPTYDPIQFLDTLFPVMTVSWGTSNTGPFTALIDDINNMGGKMYWSSASGNLNSTTGPFYFVLTDGPGQSVTIGPIMENDCAATHSAGAQFPGCGATNTPSMTLTATPTATVPSAPCTDFAGNTCTFTPTATPTPTSTPGCVAGQPVTIPDYIVPQVGVTLVIPPSPLYVIRNQSDWNNYCVNQTSVPAPPVDFNNEMILAYSSFSGDACSNYVNFTQVCYTGTQVEVFYDYRDGSLDSSCQPIVCAEVVLGPYTIAVQVPHSDLPVTWIENDLCPGALPTPTVYYVLPTPTP